MKILLAYDGMERSRNALDETVELAGEGKAEVTIVSVVPEKEARASKAGGHQFLAPHAHQDVANGRKYLRENGVVAETKILYGDPAEEISREAREGGYDLIVAGSRQPGTLGRLVLGSVSGRLVKEAPCPVVVAGEGVAVRHEPSATIN